jgi:hypothetical protein
MNSFVWDNFHIDEVVFEINSNFQAQAREELSQLIRGWVIKHVITSGAWHAGSLVEQVSVRQLLEEQKNS